MAKVLCLFVILSFILLSVYGSGDDDFFSKLKGQSTDRKALEKCFSKFAYDDCENRGLCCTRHNSTSCWC
ncbi:hypothetical protein Ddc_17580 [Ditylenchus destructor]|nr:hypothetical protein Ddc_17580 [Ditylenchus destructor]